MPASLSGRLALLLAGVLATMVALALLSARLIVRDDAIAGATRAADNAILAIDTVLGVDAGGDADARLSTIGVRRAPAPPLRDAHLFAWWSLIEAGVAAGHPGRDVFVDERPHPVLWIADADGRAWSGIPLADLRRPLLRNSLVLLLCAMAVVAVAATLAARTLVAPLSRLADAAPAIARGQPPPRLPAGTPRELQRLSRALADAAGAVRASEEERHLMLAGISHDMRTPLARLGFALEIAQIEPGLRSGIDADIAELDAIAGQFIAYARDGRDETPIELDAGGVLGDALEAQRRAGIAWVRTGESGARVQAQPLALRRALDNLLLNARLHGRAPFEAALRIDAHEVAFVVRDSGDGVPHERLDAIGRPFVRADPARGRAGSGLGLAIVGRIAAAHAGRLHWCNRDEGGFEVVLALPRTA